MLVGNAQPGMPGVFNIRFLNAFTSISLKGCLYTQSFDMMTVDLLEGYCIASAPTLLLRKEGVNTKGKQSAVPIFVMFK